MATISTLPVSARATPPCQGLALAYLAIIQPAMTDT